MTFDIHLDEISRGQLHGIQSLCDDAGGSGLGGYFRGPTVQPIRNGDERFPILIGQGEFMTGDNIGKSGLLHTAFQVAMGRRKRLEGVNGHLGPFAGGIKREVTPLYSF